MSYCDTCGYPAPCGRCDDYFRRQERLAEDMAADRRRKKKPYHRYIWCPKCRRWAWIGSSCPEHEEAPA